MEDVIKNITKNKEAAIKFLKSAGIMDDNGELSEMYRSEQKPIEWSKDFEENIRILLHDKLTWRSEDGSISSLVVIDDKTLKDIVTGIWFYVGKEINKYSNKELKVEQKPIEKQSMLKKLREHLANTPKEQLDAEFEALKNLTIDKPAEWSKEDKEMLLSAMEYIQTYPAHRQSVVDWLKNLPNRFYPQPKTVEWNEEDVHNLNRIVGILVESSNIPNWWNKERLISKEEMERLVKYLKSFSERFNLNPKQERSDGYKEDKSRTYIESYTYKDEELRTRVAFYTYKDEDGVLYLSNLFVEETSRNQGFGTKILKAAEKFAEAIGATCIRLKVKQDSFANAWYRKNGYGYMTFEDGYDWLEKTLEYLKPQWKPSEEQIEALEWMLTTVSFKDGGYGVVLKNLINDLKKQM